MDAIALRRPPPPSALPPRSGRNLRAGLRARSRALRLGGYGRRIVIVAVTGRRRPAWKTRASTTTFALKSTCMQLLAHKMVLEAKHKLGDLPVELECAPVDRAVVPGWTAAQEARGMMLYVPVPLFLHDPRDAAVDWECVGDDDHDRDVVRGLDFLELRERNSTRRRRFLRLQCRHDDDDDDDANRVVVPNDSVLEQVHRIVAACLASSHAP